MPTQAPTRRLLVPAREGRAVAVAAGSRFRVVDLEGGQVGDLFAFVAPDLTEHISAAHTRAHLDRLFPRPGQELVSDRRRPLLRLDEDTSPGEHDLLIPACDPARYAALGAGTGHASCAENLQTALAPFGVRPEVVPQPVNLFMRIPVVDGRLEWRPALSEPGDSVTFTALDDLVVVLSACPQDLVDINGGVPTPMAIDLLGAA